MVGSETVSIFGFAEFVAALALLVIIYTVSDVRYRFRIAIAPLPIYPITFGAIVLIGLGTLLIDVWYAEGWPTLPGLVGQAGLQAIFGAIFLLLICLWMGVAFLRPPKFGKRNAEKFAHALYRYIVRGAEADLSVIADELTRSAKSLVAHCPEARERWAREGAKEEAIGRTEGLAHDILLLIGNKRFCRQIAKDSPHTAIAIFDAMTQAEKFRLPLAQFAQNVATQALINEDSILYHEADEFSSDLIGQIKPFSRAFFGNFRLVEALTLGVHSPLAVHWWRAGGDLSARQYEAFSTALETLIASYISTGPNGGHPRSIIEGFSVIEHLTSDLYTLNELPKGYWESEPCKRLKVAIDFSKAVIKLLDEGNVKPQNPVKSSNHHFHQFDIYDHLADLASKIVLDASPVDGEPNWTIQHNMIWGELHNFNNTPAWRQFRRRLHRRLYDEVCCMDKYLNYKGARVIAFLLNVLGVEAAPRKGYDRHSRPLHISLLRWVKANYLRVHEELPDVAASCLVGGITFDAPNSRLVKTYAKGLSREPARRYLDLAPPSPPATA